jgi:hypothetical protein
MQSSSHRFAAEPNASLPGQGLGQHCATPTRAEVAKIEWRPLSQLLHHTLKPSRNRRGFRGRFCHSCRPSPTPARHTLTNVVVADECNGANFTQRPTSFLAAVRAPTLSTVISLKMASDDAVYPLGIGDAVIHAAAYNANYVTMEIDHCCKRWNTLCYAR